MSTVPEHALSSYSAYISNSVIQQTFLAFITQGDKSVKNPMEQRFFLFLLLLQAVRLPLDVSASSRVEFLPGFQEPLPFELETGYVGVDESSDVQLFYYFIKSEGNPKEDPLLLWLTGGPGCSALSGLAFRIGPMKFRYEEYNGSIPTLVYNPHSWTKVSSIIFVDLPVGTGFSYARTPLALQSNDFILVRQANEFLRKWLLEHPEFLSHPVYIGGDSYSGITIPAIVQQISDGIEKGIKPHINLKGYLIGNPVTNATFDLNSKIPFAHGMGLISDELYKSLKTSCRGEYQSIDPRNTACLKYVQAFEECTSSIQNAHILERKCVRGSQKPIEIQYGGRRSLNDNSLEYLEHDPSVPEFGCRSYAYLLGKYRANEISVRKALHVREGSIGEWVRCNDDLPYTKVIHNSVIYHAYLGTKGYRALIYSGDHDFLVPFVGTQTWIRSLNYSIVDDWRPWYLEGQVAGYTRTYSNQMTFATVKGAGHTAPEYKPRECLAMLTRWISEVPL